ncbi:YgeY family selenium metabolism-linked hydrolase [Ethanoligenens sp.]|uniref:YgeY family selenium metabolism-linked hydrolase n=1 Tax=Ethanoligenens sp. TaxID=2099655 RepID=UPI0039EBC7BA
MKKTVADICKELIRIPSMSGCEKDIATDIGELFQALGYDDVQFDRYGNVIGFVNGRAPGKTLLFDGHMDTVPVLDAEKWAHPPFAAEEQDGSIYGRGASDMKGALGAMIAAGARLAKDRDFSGRVAVAGVVHEECFEGVASREISKNVQPDFVVIGEASNLEIACGQKGRAEICVETFGKSAHSANPQIGINAVLSMQRLIAEIERIPVTLHPKMGDGVLTLTDIKSSPYPGASVVPDYCKATYDRRILPGETKDEILKPIREVILRLSSQDAAFQAQVSITHGEETCYTGAQITGERFFPAWILDEQDPYVQHAMQGIQRAGMVPHVHYYSFCTNGSHYAGEANIKTIGFGPMTESMAHVRDERIEIKQLQQASAAYFEIAKSVLQ